MNLDWRKALRGSSVDQTAKLVGFVLDTYANREGLCWPSRETIATGASCDVRTIDQATRRLEARGFLTVQRSPGRHVNRYRLTFPNREPGSPLEAATANDVRHNREPDSTVTANVDRPNREPGSPEAGSKPPRNTPEKPGDDEPIEEPANGKRELPAEAREFLERIQTDSLLRSMP